MKITTYILLSFLFILLLFSLTTYINFRLSEDVKENSQYVATSGEVLRNTSRFQRNMLNMVSGLRGYLIVGEKHFIDSYDSAVLDNEIILQQLATLITDTAEYRTLKQIQALNNKWTEEYTAPLRQAKLLATVSDSALLAYNKLYKEKFMTGGEQKIQEQLQQKFRMFSNAEYDKRDVRKRMLDQSARRAQRLSFTLTSISVLASFIIVGFLIRKISGRISSMVTMANAIAAGQYHQKISDLGKDELSSLVLSLNKMAQSLEQNIALLETKNKELDQYAHIVSHDLKGPLRGIDNVVGWIEEDHYNELSPKVQEYLTVIKGRIVRAEKLIEGILAYVKINKKTIEKEIVHLPQLIEEVLESITRPENVAVKVEESLPALFTEKLLLYQVFYNLISNAIKHNDKVAGLIKIYAKKRPEGYEFFVEDNGPGIAATYHQRIFGIFQVLKERDSFESTGVGLAIVKKILDARGEKVHLESVVGKGSTFSFTWAM